MPRRLRALQRDWDDLASVDPFWAVLTQPAGKHGNWDREAFFAAGRRDVDRVLDRAARLGLPLQRRRALDFGCGLGRTARALAARFAAVSGVDVSARMVSAARALNRDVPNCSFEVNAAEDLSRFDADAFDMVLSLVVLQHLPSDAMIAAYIEEFVRVTAPGGLIAFQLPERLPPLRRLQPRHRAYSLLRAAGVGAETLYRRLGLDPLRVRAVAPDDVQAMLAAAGATLLAAEPDTLAGAFPSATYYATPARS